MNNLDDDLLYSPALKNIALPDVDSNTILMPLSNNNLDCTVMPIKMEKGVKYNALIYGPITQPKNYMSLLRVCSKATEDDIISVAIDTIGGSVSTAIAIKTALESTKAKVRYVALGDVMSAGTLLFDGTGDCEICEYARFMYHMSSSVAMGNTTTVINTSKQLLSYITDYLNEALENNCITQEEFSMIVDKGQDIYITAEEMASRLKKDIYKR